MAASCLLALLWLPAPTGADLHSQSLWFGSHGAFAASLFVACRGQDFLPKQLSEEHSFSSSPRPTQEQLAVLRQPRGSCSSVGSGRPAEITEIRRGCGLFQAENQKRGPGLGAQGRPNRRQSNETYRDAVRRVMFARYKELE